MYITMNETQMITCIEQQTATRELQDIDMGQPHIERVEVKLVF